MKKTITKEKSEHILLGLTSEMKKVIAFTQTPSENQFNEGSDINNGIKASELFSFFTANIIKEETIFTR